MEPDFTELGKLREKLSIRTLADPVSIEGDIELARMKE